MNAMNITGESGPHFSNYKFVFICGLHRSGTTILGRCLLQHPLISGLTDTGVVMDEGQYLQSVYPLERRFGAVGRMGFYPEIHLTETSSLVTNENRRKLFYEWAEHWDLNKMFLMEKSPSNILRTRFLQAMFPNSYFIVLIRHPISVALASQKWSRTSIFALIEHWLRCHEIFEEDKPSLQNVLCIKYEKFVDNTQDTLGEIAQFLDVHPWTISSPPLRNLNDQYYFIWRSLLARGRTEAVDKQNVFDRIWRRLFVTIEARFVNRGYKIVDSCYEASDALLYFEDRVRRFGYSLSDY